MLNKAFHQNTEGNRLIRLAMVFVLLFATAHVALHDLDVNASSLDVPGECQVCRLNHVPVASLVMPFLFTPLPLSGHLLPVVESEYHLSHQRPALWARAPPLF